MRGAAFLALRRALAAVVLFAGGLAVVATLHYHEHTQRPSWAIPIAVVISLVALAVALLLSRRRPGLPRHLLPTFRS